MDYAHNHLTQDAHARNHQHDHRDDPEFAAVSHARVMTGRQKHGTHDVPCEVEDLGCTRARRPAGGLDPLFSPSQAGSYTRDHTRKHHGAQNHGAVHDQPRGQGESRLVVLTRVVAVRDPDRQRSNRHGEVEHTCEDCTAGGGRGGLRGAYSSRDGSSIDRLSRNDLLFREDGYDDMFHLD